MDERFPVAQAAAGLEPEVGPDAVERRGITIGQTRMRQCEQRKLGPTRHTQNLDSARGRCTAQPEMIVEDEAQMTIMADEEYE